jgi:hypothetical protein
MFHSILVTFCDEVKWQALIARRCMYFSIMVTRTVKKKTINKKKIISYCQNGLMRRKKKKIVIPPGLEPGTFSVVSTNC